MSQRRAATTGKTGKFVYVFAREDGAEQKYKLVVKGELRQLGTRKIKRYLAQATGVPVEQQQLFFRDQELPEDWDGDDIGLYDGAELFMEAAPQPTRGRREISRHEEERDEGRGATARRTTATVSIPAESRATSRCLTFPDDAAPPPPRPSLPRPTENRPRSRSPVELTAAATAQMGRLSRLSGDGDARLSPQRAGRPSLRQDGRGTHHHPDSDGASFSFVGEDGEELAGQGRGSQHASSSSVRPGHSTHSRTGSETAWIPSRHSRTSYRTSGRPSTSSSSQQQHRDPRLSVLEAENEAMQRENDLLRTKLLEVERRAANATSDWQLQEQIEELQDALLEMEAQTGEAVREAEQRARVKEEELVRELDALRDERRRLRREQAMAEQEQRETVDALRAQLRAQRAELNDRDEVILQLRANLASHQSRQNPLSPLSPCSSPNASRRRGASAKSVATPQQNAGVPLESLVQASLDRLALVFNAGDLTLRENNTCVLQADTDDLTSDETVSLLITLDRATERLYLYATILAELPQSAQTRLHLYERLLEGSLLGKDMAGAGVGISKESGLVLMSTSVDVRRSDPNALAAAARPFVAAVRDWMVESAHLLSLDADF